MCVHCVFGACMCIGMSVCMHECMYVGGSEACLRDAEERDTKSFLVPLC